MVNRFSQERRRAFALVACVAAAAGICSAQFFPSPPEMAAKVVSLSGQVSVLHDTEPWVLNVGDAVQTQQVIVSGPDGYAKLQVSDGSTFEVFPNSTVVFRNNPPNWRDLLDVLVGRIKIHIQKWGGQPNFNRIHTPTAVISVRGTTFDVSVNPDDESTLIAVEEGQVDVRHALKGGDTKTLNAGESLEVYKNEPLASRTIDRGAIAQRLLKALNEALYTMAINSRAPSGIGTTVGGGSTAGPVGSGQTQRTPPPTTAPPPPSPPAAP